MFDQRLVTLCKHTAPAVHNSHELLTAAARLNSSCPAKSTKHRLADAHLLTQAAAQLLSSLSLYQQHCTALCVAHTALLDQ